MPYLENSKDANYYSDSSAYGNYQFVSLQNIIDQFMVAYVGDEKLIRKASKIDVSFHAQRALAELSFDTFKSIKAYEIDLPPSLSMILPMDYVNYTSVSWVDASGIKHRLYPTRHTSNPFEVLQEADGSYSFPSGNELLANTNFDDATGLDFAPWEKSKSVLGTTSHLNGGGGVGLGSSSSVVDGVLNFKHSSHGLSNGQNFYGAALCVWQRIDVRGLNVINVSGEGTTVASASFTWKLAADNRWVISGAGVKVPQIGIVPSLAQTQTVGGPYEGASPAFTEGTELTLTAPDTTLRLGISATPGDIDSSAESTNGDFTANDWIPGDGIDGRAVVEWSGGAGDSFQQLSNIDVSSYDYLYIKITSTAPWTTHSAGEPFETFLVTNTIDNISVINSKASEYIQSKEVNSSTWSKYKSITPAENNNDDYKNDDYQRVPDERYGLDPAHAQTNGSFYVDEIRGKINFSSNISGKTVILDYISDSLGTQDEMQVHKLAEEAMYRCINHAVLSNRVNVPEYIIRRLKKEKIASIRQAKLRLSNIKLEEITQILRGKSKQIKH